MLLADIPGASTLACLLNTRSNLPQTAAGFLAIKAGKRLLMALEAASF